MIKDQTIYDANTGVTVEFGTHVGSGNKYIQIKVGNKTSTVTFGPDGQVMKILPHVVVPDRQV